jgi:subtilisin family serine protease
VKVWIDAAPAAVPNDPDLPQQWALNDVRVGSVWASSQFGSNTIKVCMVDTGSDITHPDLASNLWINPGESNAGGATSANGYVNGVDDDKNGTQPLPKHTWPFAWKTIGEQKLVGADVSPTMSDAPIERDGEELGACKEACKE